MQLLISIFTALGLLLIALAVPLVRRVVPPNAWYGVRVNATMSDEWVWYEANARSGRDLLVLGVGQVFLSLLLAFAGLKENIYAAVNVSALLAGTVTFAVIGIRRANRLLAERRATGAAA